MSFTLVGCASIPKDFLKLPEGYIEKRQLQIRHYDTTDEEKIITAVAGVLQDLGFILDESETKVGLVAASKKQMLLMQVRLRVHFFSISWLP